MIPGKVKLIVIDDRTREFIDDCPFFGPQGRCNVNQTSDPRCFGAEHESCALQDYDRFIVSRDPRIPHWTERHSGEGEG